MDNLDCCDKNNKRGEIATLLVIASLVVIGVSTIASTFLSKGKQTTSSSAKMKKQQSAEAKPYVCMRYEYKNTNCEQQFTENGLGCFSDNSKERGCIANNTDGTSSDIIC